MNEWNNPSFPEIPEDLSDETIDQLRAALREQLEKNDKGAVVNSIQNCVTVMEYDPVLAGKIRRNLLTETDDLIGELPWKRNHTRFNDRDVPEMNYYFEVHYGIRSERAIDNALKIVASRNSFHPIRDVLSSLQWDGIPRVRQALHHFLGAEESDYNEACLRVFMLGAVKRVFEPGCKFELMLILTGGQGAGKSSFFRFLALRDEWFTDDIRHLDDDCICRRLSGHWICELSELVATANAKSIEEIKSFLSRDKDIYRLPYDRYPSDHLRQSVFAGTTNKADFLPMDRTGNRRFLPVEVNADKAETHILDDPDASRAYIRQLWAEIMVQYRSGNYSVHLSKEEEAKLAREQEKFSQEDILAGQIYAYLETYAGDKVCTKQLYTEALSHFGVEPKQWETREICEVVNRGIANGSISGWRAFHSPRRFPKYGTQKGWERIPQPPPEPTAEQMRLIPIDIPPEELPF